jgi:hypothetical protein
MASEEKLLEVAPASSKTLCSPAKRGESYSKGVEFIWWFCEVNNAQNLK